MFKNNNKKINVIFSTILAIFIILSFVQFILSAYTAAKDSTQSHLMEISVQTANTIKVKMDDSLSVIRGYSRLLDTSVPLDSPETIQSINDICRNSDFSRIWVTDRNGVAHSSDGGVSNASGRGYFTAAMRQESGITGVMKSVYNDKNIFIVYAPLIHERKVVGMIHGTYEVDQLTQSFPLESFDNYGYSYLFEANGDILLSSSNENSFNVKDNILNFIEKTQVTPQNAYVNMLKNTKSGKSGNIQFTAEGKLRYATYCPVGISDWYILSVIPRKVVDNSIKPTILSAIALTIKISIAFVAMLFAIMWLERKNSRRIANAYNEISMLNDNLPGGVQKRTADEYCEFIYLSEGFIRMFGYSRQEIKEKFANKLINIVLPEDKKKIAELLKSVLPVNGDVRLEYRIKSKEGKIIWVSDKCRLKEEHEKSYYYCSITDITQSKNAEQALHVVNEQYRIATSQIESLVYEYNPVTGAVIYADESMALQKLETLIRKVPDDVISTQFVQSKYLDRYNKAYEKIREGAEKATCEVKAKLRDRGYIWQKLSLLSIFNENREQLKVIGIMQDISREKEIALRLEEQEHYRSAILGEAIYYYEFNLNTGVVTSAYSSKKGRVDYEDIEDAVDEEHIMDIHPSDRDKVIAMSSPEFLWRVFYGEIPEVTMQYRTKSADGTWKWIELTIRLLTDPSDNQVKGIAYAKDIDDKKKEQLELREKAERDSMTGLYNRKTLEERVNACLMRDSSAPVKHALMLLDVDHFKNINDSLGHMKGDELLCKISAILESEVRKTDVVGRLGGDEFVVFINDIRTDNMASLKAHDLCAAVELLENDFAGKGSTSISVGIAIAPKNGKTFDELYKNADSALYRTKENGKNGFTIAT